MPSLLKARGLDTYNNELTAREGALIEADNVVIDKDDVIAPRRGFGEYGDDFGIASDRSSQTMIYKDRILHHYNSILQFDSDGAGTLSDFSGSYDELESGLRLKYIESNGNFYFTTSAGIKKISASSASEFTTDADYITQSGGPKALHIESSANNNISGFLTEESKTAYRNLWGYKDKNNNLILGSPSERKVVSNADVAIGTVTAKTGIALDDMTAQGTYTGTAIAANPLQIRVEIDGTGTPDTFKWSQDGGSTFETPATIALTGSAQTLTDGITITFDATTGHTSGDYWDFDVSNPTKEVELTLVLPDEVNNVDYFYQIYRTGITTVSGAQTIDDIDPGDEMNLVYEANLTSAEIAANEVIYTDITPDSFREGGALLYTNPISGDGILQANEKPPIAKDMALFKESTFYGNTQAIHRKQFSLLSSSELTHEDTVFSDSTTYDLANALKVTMDTHGTDFGGSGEEHITEDTGMSGLDSIADATSFATLLTLTNALKDAYIVHNADAILVTPIFHIATGGGDALSSIADVTTVAEAATMLNDLKAKYNLHDADAVAHTTGSTNQESQVNSNTTFLDDCVSGGVYTEETLKNYIVEIDSADLGLTHSIDLANDLKSKYNAHIADTSDHTTGADATNTIAASDATDLTSLITLVTEMVGATSTAYHEHDDDAELGGGWAYHAAQEASDHTLSDNSAPSDLAECIERLNDFKEKYNGHDADDTAHGVGSQHQCTLADATDADTFKWSDDGGGTWTELVQIDGGTQDLSYGISVVFSYLYNHEVGNRWQFAARPTKFYVGNSDEQIEYMFTDTTDIANRKVAVSTSASVATSIDETARELIRVVNRDTGALTYGYYLSGPDDLPGIILFESRNLGDDTFYLGISTDIGTDFSPTFPVAKAVSSIGTGLNPTVVSPGHGLADEDTVYLNIASTPVIHDAFEIEYVDADNYKIVVDTAITLTGTGTGFESLVFSDNEVSPNRVYFSKTGQPEAVPLTNYVDVGPKDSAIKRIVALRDNLFVLKEDGVYIVSGTSAPNFSVSLLDNSVKIEAADTADVLNNQIYVLTSQGIGSISDTGVGIISRSIENLINDVTNARFSNYKTISFGLSYQSDRAYYVWLPTKTTDTYATQCYRYNIFNKTWTRWTKEARCGVVNPNDDKLYLGSSNDNVLLQERKNGNRTDFADIDFATASTSSGVNANVITLVNLTNVEIGDVLYQEQWVTVSRFNRLLRKMDLDGGLTDSDYYSTLAVSTGDNIFTSLEALRVKVDADDTGASYVTTSPSTFEEAADEYNMIVNTMNGVASDATFKTYTTISDSTFYESIIISKDTVNTQVTCSNTVPFFEGAFTIFKGYEQIVEWAPQDFGDPSVLKQIHEGTIVFDGNAFYNAKVAYASDLSKGFDSVTFPGQGSGTWGGDIWGDYTWGGEGDDKPFRTLIPRLKQRCRHLSCKFTHINAREDFSILGMSLTMRSYSTRAYRGAD